MSYIIFFINFYQQNQFNRMIKLMFNFFLKYVYKAHFDLVLCEKNVLNISTKSLIRAYFDTHVRNFIRKKSKVK